MPQKKTKTVKVWDELLGQFVDELPMDQSVPDTKLQDVYNGMERARRAAPAPKIQPAWQTESPIGGTHASLPVQEPLGIGGVQNPNRPPGQAADAQSMFRLLSNRLFNPELINTGASEDRPVFEGRPFTQPDVENLGTTAAGVVGGLARAPFAQALRGLLGRSPSVAPPNIAPLADGYAGASAPTRMSPMSQTFTEPMYGTNVTVPNSLNPGSALNPAQSAHNLASNVAAESGIPSRLNTVASGAADQTKIEAELVKALKQADVGKPGSAASYGPFNEKGIGGVIDEFRTNPVFRAAAMRALRIGGGTVGTVGTAVYGLYRILRK